MAYWLRCWTLNSKVVSSRPTLGTVHFQSLGNFVYPTLPQSAANEYKHCLEGTCDGLVSRPGESV